MLLPCPVCSSIDSTAVTSELNITAGDKCTLKESGKHMNNANCSDFNFYWFEFKFETAAGSYLCHIVTPLELSKDCRVESTRNATVCDSTLPVCTYGQPQTDSQCVAQIITTPVLPSTTLSTQTNFTGSAGAVSEPTPSVSPSSIGCTLGRVSCPIVYLAAGLGALAVIVALLVVVVIVLACISVKRGKKKMQSERECILLCVVVASKLFLHKYFIVFHLPRC